MRQDGLQKRKSEVELFAGTVIKLADKHKIDVQVNKKIYETILKIEGSIRYTDLKEAGGMNLSLALIVIVPVPIPDEDRQC